MVESPRCLPTPRSTTTAWPPGTRPTWPGSRLTPSQTRTPPWGRPPHQTCGRTSSPMRGRRTSSASERTMQRNMKGGHLHNLCPRFCLSFTEYHMPLFSCPTISLLIFLFGILRRSSNEYELQSKGVQHVLPECLSLCHLSCPPQRCDQPTELANPPRSKTLVASHLPEKNQPQYGHPGPSQTMGLFPVSTNVSFELRLSSGA